MASVRERVSKAGDTTWQVLYRVGTKQQSTTFVTPTDAEKFRQLVEILGPSRALAELASQQTAGPTVDELAEKFFAWKAGDVEPRTLADYRRDYDNHIKARLGARRANSIDEVDVQDLVDHLATRLGPKSVADKHMILHSMFKFGSARTRRLVDHNPCTETSLPKRGRATVKGATLPEWLALGAAAREVDPDAADLLDFLAATGWRFSEAIALHARDVADWASDDGRTVMRATMGQVFRKDAEGRSSIVADAKSQAGLRVTKVPPTAAAVVRRRIDGLGPDDLVFTNGAGRRWYQQNFLNRTWRRIEEKAGLDRHLTPHSLRHLHVALLDRAGATLAQMQRRVGHEDIQTTINVYGGMIDDVDDAVLARLDALLTPG